MIVVEDASARPRVGTVIELSVAQDVLFEVKLVTRRGDPNSLALHMNYRGVILGVVHHSCIS